MFLILYINHNILNTTEKSLSTLLKKCGYEWQTTPLVRMNGNGCKKYGYKSAAKKKNKKVAQFSIDGQFIKEYNSVEEARKETGVQHISCVCRGDRKKAGGYIWKYVEE